MTILSFGQDDLLTGKQWIKIVNDPLGSDTVGGTTAATYSINIGKPEGTEYYYDHAIFLDSLGDGTNVTVTLQGSYDNSEWVNIGSSQTWTCDVDDTILYFKNTAPSESVASTIASHTEIHSGTASNGAYSWLAGDADTIFYDDTVTISAQTVTYTDTITVAAQTITNTVTKATVIGYPYQRFYLLGAGANAGTDITKIRWAFIKPKND